MQDRRDVRLMSSLRDLRLQTIKKQLNPADEGKRKTKRFCPIKRDNLDQQIYENFTIKHKNKTKLDKDLILKSLSSHFIFSSLIQGNHLHQLLLDKFVLCQVNEGDYLIKQNDNASSFFILHEGRLSVEINGDQKRKIYPGEGFGQLALLYSAPRSASIKAERTSYLWYIDRTTFRNLVETIIQKNYTENRKFIEHNKFFTYLTEIQKDKLSSIGITQRYQKNTKICKEGELASSMFILKAGELRRSVEGIQVGVVKPGDSFEQYAVMGKNNNRKETITALEDSQIIAFGTQDIQITLGKSLPIIIVRNQALNALKSSEYFSKLLSVYLDKIIDQFKIKKLSEGQYAVKKGMKCRDTIFFIIQGDYAVENGKNQPLHGHQSIMTEYSQKLYNYDIKFQTEGRIAWITKQQIQSALGITFQNALLICKEMTKSIEKLKDNRKQQKQYAQKLNLNEFQVLKKLGEGQFGTVYLVTDSSKSNVYALKCISKFQSIRCKLQKHLLNQKKVLQQINSPFAVEYIRSFKDNNYIYFLMEFINGVQLFDAIRLIGLLNINQSKFYTGILLHVLEELHESSIIYRDLKPQNVMVGEDGYLKLIDMGTCKSINPKSTVQKTFTIIGTPNYMAPQIIAGKGYTYTVDLWSLGVILYEFLAGYVPFGQDAEDPYQIYQEILKNPLTFPKHVNDANTISFISQMLNKNADARLGGSYQSLKNHNFFKGFQWNCLVDKRIQPPFLVPKDKFVDVKKLMGGIKPVNKVLKPNSKPMPPRKDLNPNWDETF